MDEQKETMSGKDRILKELSRNGKLDGSNPRITLAHKIDTLEKPSREIDAEIARLSGFGLVAQEWHYEKLEWYAWHAPERRGHWEIVKKYTGSLDAAMSLAENSGFAGLYLKIAEQLIAEEFAHECKSVEDYRFELAKAFCIVALYSKTGKARKVKTHLSLATETR